MTILTEARPQLVRRADYSHPSSADSYIVTLLHKHIVEVVNEFATSGHNVLDVGCGEQPFRALIESRGCIYAGADVEQNQSQNVDFVAPIDSELPHELSTKRFDFILCTEVLEHVCDWDAAFYNLAYLLKPAGRLLITCPFMYPPHEEPYDFWRPTQFSITQLAQRHGFRVVRHHNAGSGWDVLGTLLGFTHPVSKSRSLTDRSMCWLFRKVMRLCVWACNSRSLQNKVVLNSKFYLSNITILQKAEVVDCPISA